MCILYKWVTLKQELLILLQDIAWSIKMLARGQGASMNILLIRWARVMRILLMICSLLVRTKRWLIGLRLKVLWMETLIMELGVVTCICIIRRSEGMCVCLNYSLAKAVTIRLLKGILLWARIWVKLLEESIFSWSPKRLFLRRLSLSLKSSWESELNYL